MCCAKRFPSPTVSFVLFYVFSVHSRQFPSFTIDRFALDNLGSLNFSFIFTYPLCFRAVLPSLKGLSRLHIPRELHVVFTLHKSTTLPLRAVFSSSLLLIMLFRPVVFFFTPTSTSAIEMICYPGVVARVHTNVRVWAFVIVPPPCILCCLFSSCCIPIGMLVTGNGVTVFCESFTQYRSFADDVGMGKPLLFFLPSVV